MRFASREQAAQLLFEQLRRFKDHHPLVLGIPRGGVPMAKVLAERLGCAFDVVLVRKLRTPDQPELAMGAVDEAGHVYRFGAKTAISPELYTEEVAEQTAEVQRRRQLYSRDVPALSPSGHTAIVVDDGMLTGTTMVASIRAVRAFRPLRVVVAVPVSARGAIDLARSYADEVICLHSPRLFYAIEDFYDDFTIVADADVVSLLDARTA
jgi:predicted phosphoribosyltransferase